MEDLKHLPMPVNLLINTYGTPAWLMQALINGNNQK